MDVLSSAKSFLSQKRAEEESKIEIEFSPRLSPSPFLSFIEFIIMVEVYGRF
jgi:hypothetical protein